VRALLIVNPRATSTTGLRRDVIARALSSAVDLSVTETRYRGHATRLAGAALADGHGLVLTLGGDGTANEAINGIMAAGRSAGRATADVLPAFAPLPGGSANVFTRALGLPPDPVDAGGQVLRSLASGQQRSIGLGLAMGRYFAFNAGLGLARARQWTRTPALMTQLFTDIVGIYLVQGSRLEWGIPALALAAAGLVTLFAPASTKALARGRPASPPGSGRS